MQRDELAAWLRLALTDHVGNESARRLLAAFGLPQAIFSQSRAALEQIASPAQCDALLKVPPQLEALVETTLDWLGGGSAEVGRGILTLADAAYPAALLNTADPPLLLYATGQLSAGFPRSVSIVGSRNPTAQGAANARAFAKAFAQTGLAVVSGMALGIDTAAHEGALEGSPGDGFATIAVVGTGLDRVYPKKNLDLAHRIAHRGLILSEFHLGTPPLDQNFPKRNRIISALGQGTLVVEAALRSGSLITARMAIEQGKEVFAIPGSIHSPQSRGCHLLIKQGAKLVETAEDVLEELHVPIPSTIRCSHRSEEAPESEASDDDRTETRSQSLLEAMGYDPVGLDALIARTGIPAPVLQANLLELELAGDVARLPGGLYQRIGSA